MGSHADLVARYHGSRPPTAADQTVRRAHLEPPFRSLPLVVRYHQEEPSMWIGPSEFRNLALYLNSNVGIEHGEGMMRISRNDKHTYGKASEKKCFRRHLSLQNLGLQIMVTANPV